MTFCLRYDCDVCIEMYFLIILQREVLLESLLPGYKRKKEAEEAERQRKKEMEQTRNSLSN